MDLVIEDYIKIQSNINLEKNIDDKLSVLKLPSFNTLKPNIQEHLKQIEMGVHTCEVLRNEYLSRYKKNKISVFSIVKKIGISRQTVYNNREVLEAYVLQSQELQDKQDIFAQDSDLRERINDLNKDICKLQLRDVVLEKLKIDYQVVLRERDDGLKQIENLSKHIGDLYKKIELLERTNNKRVVPLTRE